MTLPSQRTPGPDHSVPRRPVASRLLVLARSTEPAMVRAAATAVVSGAAALGVALPFDLPGLVEAGIALAAVLVPLAQGAVTRAAVYSPASHHQAVGRATAGLSNGPRD